MRAIRRDDTKPERAVRALLHAMGYRFRLQWRAAPGTPDVAFPGRRKAIFVHGCFWHAHGCPKGRAPRTRKGYWLPKLARNKERDAETLAALRALGWRALVLWECEIARGPERLAKRLARFIGPVQAASARPRS